jgi:hypothetical protein
VTDIPDDGRVRPFALTLQEIGAGRLAARVSEQLADLTSAVVATGKKGSIVLKIEVAPVKKATANTLMVSGSSVAKIPEPEDAAPTSVFFATDDGVLSRDDPHQPQLPLRIAPGKATA